MTPLAKKLAIFLVISVAINLLVIGFLVGRGLKQPPARRAEWHGLNAADARKARHPLLREAMDRHRADFDARRGAVLRARRSVAEAAGKDPFERAALERALAELRRETSQSQEVVHQALVEACERAKPEERQKLAEQFLKAEFSKGDRAKPR